MCLCDSIYLLARIWFFILFIIDTNIHLRKFEGNISWLHEKQIKQLLTRYKVLALCLEVNLNSNYLWFSYIFHHNHELLVDLIRSQILHHSSYFFRNYLLSSVGTSIKYLFQLLSSKYPFILLIIRQNGFVLLVFMLFGSLIVTYPM